MARPGILALMKASWTTRSGTASSDQVYVLRTGTITGKPLTLNLNGASFQGLRQGSTDLVNGTDYTVSGNTLTLTASALTRLVGDRAPGVNATIEARFSQGVPWQISIITYDRPTRPRRPGRPSSFAIPTEFRGDQVATMEAKYADGTNAGPPTGPPTRSSGPPSSPTTPRAASCSKPEFFAEVNDTRAVTTRRSHFWSGTQLTYRVTKSGSTVTGSVG